MVYARIAPFIGSKEDERVIWTRGSSAAAFVTCAVRLP